MTELRLHTTALKTHSSEEENSLGWGRVVGLGVWGRMGMGDKTEKTNSPKQESSLYKGLKWMSGPSSPPRITSHDITVQQPAFNQSGVCFTSLFRPLLSVLNQSVRWSCDWTCAAQRSDWHKQNSASFMVRLTAALLCLKRKTIYISSFVLWLSSLLLSWFSNVFFTSLWQHSCPYLITNQESYCRTETKCSFLSVD